MAKKSFKGGLGSLIEDSGIQTDKDIQRNRQENDAALKTADYTSEAALENIKDNELRELFSWYKMQIKQYEEELALWRTGKLTPDKFLKSIKKIGLSYNAELNGFEKL